MSYPSVIFLFHFASAETFTTSDLCFDCKSSHLLFLMPAYSVGSALKLQYSRPESRRAQSCKILNICSPTSGSISIPSVPTCAARRLLNLFLKWRTLWCGMSPLSSQAIANGSVVGQCSCDTHNGVGISAAPGKLVSMCSTIWADGTCPTYLEWRPSRQCLEKPGCD